MKRVTKILSVMALCVMMVVLSVTPAFADTTYVENHSYVDCANYYIDGSKYMFLIKIPIGTPLSAVTVNEVYIGTSQTLENIANSFSFTEKLEYQYSDSTSDCYMYSYDMSKFGASKNTWYMYGIKLYYDYNGEHYMATNTANGSTAEGDGYRLVRPVY